MWKRNGVTREVFLVGPYAIKLPKLVYGWRMFLNGLLANMQEASFQTGDWPDLCPIVFAVPGGWLLVMRRAKPLDDEQWRQFLRQLLGDEAIHTYHPRDEVMSWNGADYCVPVEVKQDSFGVVDGRIVAVDYGN